MSAKPYCIPGVATHLIESARVGQTFQVQVMQPLAKVGAGERFPVVYLTDANALFDVAKGISHWLQVAGQVRRFILVGVGYPGDNPLAGSILRYRDMTSRRRPQIEGLPRVSLVEGVPEIAAGKPRWHGAPQFLSFIRDELIPLIDASYPTIAGERAYFGHSLGGGFGLHALFSQSGLFNRYIISSPGLSYDGDDHAIREAQDFVASGQRLDAQLAMTVGDQEEFDPTPATARAQFVSSFYRLAALLKNARVPGLELTCRAIPGETHASVWPIAFSHGVQAIYGPGEPPSIYATVAAASEPHD